MKYAVEMGLGARKVDWEINRQHGDRISLFLSFQNKKSRLKTESLRL
jgi:hypothetical protein